MCGRRRRGVSRHHGLPPPALNRSLVVLQMRTIEKNRPTGCKGKLWNTATITSTMGPGIKLDISALRAFSGAGPA